MSQTLTETIAAFTHSLSAETLPDHVLEKARACALNGFGIALGCHPEPHIPSVRQAAFALDGEQAGGATVLGDGRKTSIAGALLANCTLFHARIQEDTCGAAHFGVMVLPLLTALLETRNAPLSRLLPALVAGYEAGGLLERHFAPYTTPVGFRVSSLYGPIAAAAAAARLLGLDAERTAAAIANATAFTGGHMQAVQDSTDETRYQPALAAINGLMGVELSRVGTSSAKRALEGEAGFIKTLARTECDAAAIGAELGKVWSMDNVTFKPFPVCAFNQTPITAALALRGKIGGRPIAKLRIRMHSLDLALPGMTGTGPFHHISGTLMSSAFCIATTLLRGDVTMQHLRRFDDAEVNALARTATVEADETLATLCCAIEAELQDGTTVAHEQHMTPADYSYERREVSALIRRIGLESGVPTGAYDRLEGFVDALPEGDLADLLGTFAMVNDLRQAAE